LQLINPSTSPNQLKTTLTPHSIMHGDACFAYFNKIWGIPQGIGVIPIVITEPEEVETWHKGAPGVSAWAPLCQP
jgi:hypothetical protein